ncbi:glycosyltransferase family 4 protein, partial [Escherichia coli]|nr:glycosyltransferase family 4 protein [Escherichia coli]
HHAFSSGAGRTSDGNGSHASTLKSPSYTKSVSWQHYQSYYPNLNKKTIINDEDASLIERKAIEKATVVSFPSKWAMDFCRNYYRLDFDKLVEIPWGANLFDDIHFANKNIIQKNSYTCLFLGVDWERKGGKTALKAIEYVRQLYGIDVRLKICGCTPNQKILPTWVELIDKVDKNNVDEYQKFIDVLSNADILLLPTIAECYGMVFCEAAAFGLPVVATDTGGVSSIVINERTGILIKDPLDYKHFGNAIHKIISSVETYQNYSQNARIRYNNILHWDNWAKKIIEIMYEHKNRRIK